MYGDGDERRVQADGAVHHEPLQVEGQVRQRRQLHRRRLAPPKHTRKKRRHQPVGVVPKLNKRKYTYEQEPLRSVVPMPEPEHKIEVRVDRKQPIVPRAEHKRVQRIGGEERVA